MRNVVDVYYLKTCLIGHERCVELIVPTPSKKSWDVHHLLSFNGPIVRAFHRSIAQNLIISVRSYSRLSILGRPNVNGINRKWLYRYKPCLTIVDELLHWVIYCSFAVLYAWYANCSLKRIPKAHAIRNFETR